jgi:hypothetical protein
MANALGVSESVSYSRRMQVFFVCVNIEHWKLKTKTKQDQKTSESRRHCSISASSMRMQDEQGPGAAVEARVHNGIVREVNNNANADCGCGCLLARAPNWK